VSREAIARAAARIPHARLIMSHESAHEMLREADAVRLPLLAEIDRFLDETAPLR
jgi:lysophospholipase